MYAKMCDICFIQELMQVGLTGKTFRTPFYKECEVEWCIQAGSHCRHMEGNI